MIETFINQFLYDILSNERIGRILICSNIKMADAYQIIETARKKGKIEKGTNEVTKAIERGTAKFVAYAADVEPKEIVQHIPVLCKEKEVPCQEVDSKQKLGIAVGIPVSASAVVVVDAGDAAKDISGLGGK